MAAAASSVLAPDDLRPGRLWQAFRKNRLAWIGVVLLGLLIVMAVLAPWIAPYDPLEQDIVARLEPPSDAHWLGTDSFGRDVLTRLIYGARISLFVGFAAVTVAAVCGTAIGVVSGYIGGVFDQLVMSVLDVLLAFPTLLLGLMIAAMLGASLENLIIAIAITEVAPSLASRARRPSPCASASSSMQAAPMARAPAASCSAISCRT